MHEIGHATNPLGSRRLRDASITARGASLGTPGKFLRAIIAGNVLRGSAADDNAVSRFAYENAPALMGASYAPMLLEEARATGHALQGAGKFGPGRLETLRQLAPGFGTYIAKALSPIIAVTIAKKLLESIRGEIPEQEKLSAAEVRAPGLLRVGPSSAWRMQPSTTKPKTTKPNTNPSARGKETAKMKPPSNKSFHKDMLESLHNPQRGFRIAKIG